MRSLFTATCITPDDDALREDFDRFVTANIEYFWGLQRDNTPMKNDLGIVWTVSGQNYYSGVYHDTGVPTAFDPVGDTTRVFLSIDPWQHAFISSALGLARGMKLVTGQSAEDLASLHAHSAKAPIGRMDFVGTGYSWRRCSSYREPVGYPSVVFTGEAGPLFNPPQSWFPDWKTCYEVTRDYWGATDNADTDTSGTMFRTWTDDRGGFVAGFQRDPASPLQGHTDSVTKAPSIVPVRSMPAPLAMAADYDVPGARAAYERFVNSAFFRNNTDARQNLANGPKFMVTPR
jgi:hypothetical protein